MPKLTKSIVIESNEPGYYKDTELKGFWLRVHKAKDGTVTKTFLVITKPRQSRKQLTVTIGKHGVISAEQARIKAKQILGDLSEGRDPNEEKREHLKLVAVARKHKETIEDLTLERVLEIYLSDRRLTEKTAKDYNGHTRRPLKDWLKLPLTEITERMVKDRHKKMSEDHPAQADYTMRILRALYSYAIEEFKNPDGSPLLKDNPVKSLKRQWNRVPRRQTAVHRHQLAGWFEAVQKLPNPTARDFLILVMLTGLRHNEAATLEWKNVDLDAKTFKVEDTKNGTDHMLPMSDVLHSLFLQRHNDTGEEQYVFRGEGKKGHLVDVRDSVKKVRDKSELSFTVHDLRRSFITCAEGLDISPYTLKKLLNHKVTGDVTSGYLVITAERLRAAMQQITDAILQHAEIDKETLSWNKQTGAK